MDRASSSLLANFLKREDYEAAKCTALVKDFEGRVINIMRHVLMKHGLHSTAEISRQQYSVCLSSLAWL